MSHALKALEKLRGYKYLKRKAKITFLEEVSFALALEVRNSL